MTTPEPTRPNRRSPSADELRVWRTFVETSEIVKGVVNEQLQSTSDVSSGDYAVLLALSEHPEHRMRSSSLAAHIGWERSRLSHHLGRMERRSLVARRTAIGDSRGAEVVLTDHGAQLFRRASAPHMHTIYSAFAAVLSTDQLAAVEDAMNALRAHHCPP